MVSDLSAVPRFEWWEPFWAEYQRNGNNATRAYMLTHPKVAVGSAKELGARTLANVGFNQWIRAKELSKLPESERWQRETIERAKRYRSDLDACREQFSDGQSKNTSPVIDPVALKVMTQAEETVDKLARRSLGLDVADSTVSINLLNVLSSDPVKPESVEKLLSESVVPTTGSVDPAEGESTPAETP